MISRTGCSCDFLRLTTAAELNNRFNMRLPAASTCIGQSPSLHESGPRTRRPVARRIVLASAFVAVLSGLAASSRAALIIGFTGSTGDVNADAGFQRAANYLQSRFSDNVSVTINRGFAALSPGVLGSAGSFTQTFTYTEFRTAVARDITTASDSVFSAGLPGGSSFSMYTNRTAENGNTATPYVDTTGENTTNVRLTTANAKALSLSTYSGTDANITFSNLFTWDFDNSDGVTAGAQDFVGVAIHELMHALGFTSGVDALDTTTGGTDDNLRAHSLDFTRHSTASVGAGADIDFTGDSRAGNHGSDRVASGTGQRCERSRSAGARCDRMGFGSHPRARHRGSRPRTHRSRPDPAAQRRARRRRFTASLLGNCSRARRTVDAPQSADFLPAPATCTPSWKWPTCATWRRPSNSSPASSKA